MTHDALFTRGPITHRRSGEEGRGRKPEAVTPPPDPRSDSGTRQTEPTIDRPSPVPPEAGPQAARERSG